MKALCIGHASYDICCIMDDYPAENLKHIVTEKNENGGGQAANEACLLAKWGAETYLAAALGNDSYAEKIKKEFAMYGVKTNMIETSFEKSTSTSVVIINKKNGSRTVLNISTPENAPRLKKEELSIEPDVILVDGYEYHASLAALNKFANKITIIDAGKYNAEVVELCKFCKYIVCSEDFAQSFTGVKIDYNNSSTLVMLYSRLKERYSKAEIIVTLGDKGALYTVNNQIKIMPGIKVDAVDTTAAGDIFHGAFAFCMGSNYDLEKSIAFANIAAGLSCASIGGRLAIPNLNNVLSYYNSKFGVPNGNTNTNQQNPQA